MPPKTQKSTLNQSKLSFLAAKPSANSNQVKKVPKKPRRSRSSIESESSSEEENVDDIELAQSDSDSDHVEVLNDSEHPKVEGQRPVVASATTSRKAKKPVKEKMTKTKPDTKKPSTSILIKEKEGDGSSRPELNVEDPAYRELYNETRFQMGHAKPIHGEKQNRINDILRVFDLTYKYGPCIGVSRLERWERAKAFGLDPPQEIYDILNTKEGVSEIGYSQSVFYEKV